MTKLTVPLPRSNWVPRPRLIERLNDGLQRKLTLISAPAGFGKTTLVANWKLSIDNLEMAWLSLDDDDNDPARFWAYVTTALQTLQPDIDAEALAVLHVGGSQPSPPKAFLTSLINDLAGLAARECWCSMITMLLSYARSMTRWFICLSTCRLTCTSSSPADPIHPGRSHGCAPVINWSKSARPTCALRPKKPRRFSIK